jgi:hypothetical protein
LSGPSATLTVTFEEGIDMRTKLRHGAHGGGEAFLGDGAGV